MREEAKQALEKIGACGMGYPDLGLPCIRLKGHSGFRDCFALVESEEGEVVGCFMQQDGKQWVTDRSEFPGELATSTPLFKEKKIDGRVYSKLKGSAEEKAAVTDRRGLVAHSKGKS